MGLHIVQPDPRRPHGQKKLAAVSSYMASMRFSCGIPRNCRIWENKSCMTVLADQVFLSFAYAAQTEEAGHIVTIAKISRLLSLAQR